MKEVKCPKCGESLNLDESEYNNIVTQIRTEEFENEVQEKLQILKENLNSKLKVEIARTETTYQKQLSEKDLQIQQLSSTIALHQQDIQIAVANEKEKISEQINKLKTDYSNLKTKYDSDLRAAHDEIERYKDFKLKLSTKMIGESLERHCSCEFSKLRTYGMFPNAYFEKDNEVKNGSKGDFIFRDYDDGEEYISIMFEMKNEADATKTKHKNEHFFEKLDQDRKNKNCEYAILVSMLEMDNEEYNVGIVDVSHKYPKMFVIRPQFFLPIIGILSKTAINSIKYKKDLQAIKSQQLNVTNFEKGLLDFQKEVEDLCEDSTKNFDKEINNLDHIIKYCQDQKKRIEARRTSLNKLKTKADDLTIQNLILDAKKLI